MNAKTRKGVLRVHRWCGAVVGVLFFLACITGAVLATEDWVTAAVYAGDDYVEAPRGATAMDADSLVAKASQQLPEGWIPGRLVASERSYVAYRLQMEKPKGAAVWVNQYDGTVTGSCGRLQFYITMQGLHRWLLDAPKDGRSAGRTIMGWAAVIGVLTVASGAVLWWPRPGVRRRAWGLTRSAWRGRARLWTMHTAFGAWTVVILLLMLLTGLSWSFPAYKEWLTGMAGQIPFKAIHTGTWLGGWSRALWCLVALAGATLPVTGFLLWLRKHRGGRKT